MHESFSFHNIPAKVSELSAANIQSKLCLSLYVDVSFDLEQSNFCTSASQEICAFSQLATILGQGERHIFPVVLERGFPTAHPAVFGCESRCPLCRVPVTHAAYDDEEEPRKIEPSNKKLHNEDVFEPYDDLVSQTSTPTFPSRLMCIHQD